MLNRLNVLNTTATNGMPGRLTSLVAYLHEGYDAWLAIYGKPWDPSDAQPQVLSPETGKQPPEQIAPH